MSSFTANGATSMSSGSISFSKVLLNEGSNFDGGSGTFTCQHPGLYFFTANIIENGPENTVLCHIRNNGLKTIKFVYRNLKNSSIEGNIKTAATGAAAFHLKTGDKVDVSCNLETLEDSSSSFTGFLVAVDP